MNERLSSGSSVKFDAGKHWPYRVVSVYGRILAAFSTKDEANEYVRLSEYRPNGRRWPECKEAIG